MFSNNSTTIHRPCLRLHEPEMETITTKWGDTVNPSTQTTGTTKRRQLHRDGRHEFRMRRVGLSGLGKSVALNKAGAETRLDLSGDMR